MRTLNVLLILTTLVGFNPRSEAHSGGLDKHGGHNNRKEGNYHFHKGHLKGIGIAPETYTAPRKAPAMTSRSILEATRRRKAA